MRIIDIKIRNRIACVPDKEAYILCGNNDYVARFDLDEEWDNYTSKIAVFVSDGEMMTNVFTGNECEIPVMRNTSLCSIGITAGDIRTSTPAYVPCLACITDGDGEIVEPTPDVYAQIMEMLDEALDRIGGVAQGKTFQDVNAMLSSLNLAKADEYIVGQNIFTIDENAPDFWITATYPDYVEFKGSQADFLLQLSQNKVVRVGYYGISLLKTQSDDYVTRPEFNIAKNDIQFLRNNKADNSRVDEVEGKVQKAIETANEANDTSINALRVTQEYGDAIQSAIDKAQTASEKSANAVLEAQTAKERADEVEEITRSFEQNIENANDKSDEALKQVADKVDKEWGKGLSSNDFTDDLKKKLEDLPDKSEENVQADWQETDPNSDSYIKNKPNLGSLAGKSTVEKDDLDSGLQHSIDRANSSLQSESDPSVPQWAKQPKKPTYTASEVGAVPDTRKVNGKQLNKDIAISYSDVGALPSSTKLSDLPEDDNHQTVTKAQKESWITKAVSDLANYYTKSSTYSKTEVNELVAKIPKFSIKVVDYLPVSDISQTTIYLLKYGSTEGNLYTEYIYADGKWEILGTQSLNLDGYATQEWVSSQGFIKSLEGYATENWVKNQGYLTQEDISNIPINNLTKITYADLKALRDNSQLTEGAFYRITDYQTTTAQNGTKASNHRFDVIVLALTKNELSEQAYATFHIEKNGQPDGYFATNEGKITDVTAWEIKYCLDNDTSRFSWALDHQRITNLESAFSNGNPLVRQPSFDGQNTYYGKSEFQYAWGTEADVEDGDPTCFIYSENEYLENGETVFNSDVQDFNMQIAEVESGKGVIYYLKDEYNNECGYDFKNILFLRDSEWVKEYHENGMFEWVEPDADGNYSDLWLYTFTKLNNGVISDASITSNAAYNTIRNTASLPDNVFVSIDSGEFTYNMLEFGCRGNTFGNVDNCKLDSTCCENIIGDYCYGVVFGVECFHNELRPDVWDTTFGDGCHDNKVSGHFNSLAGYCVGNEIIEGWLCSLGVKCNNNKFFDVSWVECDWECSGLDFKHVSNGKVGMLCENVIVNNARNLTLEQNVTNVSIKAAKYTPLADTSVFTYDDDLETLTTKAGENDRVLGTPKDVSYYILAPHVAGANIYTADFADVSEPNSAVGRPYPNRRYYLKVWNDTLGKNLFLNGERAGSQDYYLKLTENIEEAVEVGVVETNNGGYYLYILRPDNTKEYVTITVLDNGGLYIRLSNEENLEETTQGTFTKTTISKGVNNKNILVDINNDSEKIYRSANTIEIMLDD